MGQSIISDELITEKGLIIKIIVGKENKFQ